MIMEMVDLDADSPDRAARVAELIRRICRDTYGLDLAQLSELERSKVASEILNELVEQGLPINALERVQILGELTNAVVGAS